MLTKNGAKFRLEGSPDKLGMLAEDTDDTKNDTEKKIRIARPDLML